MNGIKNNSMMYFVHSFFCKPKKEEIILSETLYGGRKFCSSIMDDNVIGLQFHPEKSASIGIQIYKNIKTFIES